MKKTTIYDIAKELNMAPSTISKALNNNKRISEKVRNLVFETANNMDYVPNMNARRLGGVAIKIGVLLHCLVPEFLNEIYSGVTHALDALKHFRVEYEVFIFNDITATTQKNIFEKLDYFMKNNYHGVIIFGAEDDSFIIEKLNEMRKRSIAVATLTVDIPSDNRDISVKCDTRCAGKLAAEILTMTCTGKKVAILTSNLTERIHNENVTGFKQVVEEYASIYNENIDIVEIMEYYDDNETTVRKTHELFQKHPDISGIYISTASSVIVCGELEKMNIKNNIIVVATDLFDITKYYMQKGIINATIFQNPRLQGLKVVERLYRFLLYGDCKGDYFIIPQVVFRSDMNFKTEDLESIL